MPVEIMRKFRVSVIKLIENSEIASNLFFNITLCLFGDI